MISRKKNPEQIKELSDELTKAWHEICGTKEKPKKVDFLDINILRSIAEKACKVKELRPTLKSLMDETPEITRARVRVKGLY